MKKIISTFALVAVVAAAFTSCNKEIEAVPQIEEQDQVFTFAIGDQTGVTKSILAKDENGRFVQFDDDDNVNNSGLGCIAPNAQGFSKVDPANTPVTFSIYTKGVTENDKITVWYPYRSKQTNAAAVELEIPAEQTHKSGNNFDMKAMPMVTKQITVTADMVAASDGTYTPVATINFANMGSLLNFKVFSTNDLYAGEKVKSITFNAKNEAGTADANIGGTFTKNLATIDPDDESTMAIGSFTSGVSSIVTTPYADAAIGTSKANALDLYMVVAPGTYKGTIVVKTDVAEYTYTITNAAQLGRSKVKAYGLDLESSAAVRDAIVTVDYVTLPWSIRGLSSAELRNEVGVTSSGLGSDYASGNAPYYIKFDTTGDFIQIKTDAAIGNVSVDVKMIGGANTSSITVKESSDGSAFTDVQTLNISGAQNDELSLSTTAAFSASSRYVQLYFTKGSNVGIGSIAISKANTDPIIEAEDIEVPATGVDSEVSTYVAKNFTDDVEVADVEGFTGCVIAAIADAGQIIYSVDPNYTTSPVSGTIKLWSAANHSIAKTINVTQAASVFEASSTSEMAFAWNDETNSVEKTVTITSTFALTESENVEVSGTDKDKFTVSLTPKTGSNTEYNLGVWVNQNNTTQSSYEAVVKVKRNSLEISINLSQAFKSNIDVLNRELTGVTGSSYTNWSNIQSETDAVYAGNSAGSNSSIQLRKSSTTQDPSGIVTTTSGGYAKKVSVSWESHTVDGRTLKVYGKNTAYTSASDLYGDNVGTLLGQIIKGQSTELVIPYDCQFIGLVSDDGAMYLSEIRIEWSADASGNPLPAAGITVATLDATNTSSTEGTTATLNGTITLENGAVIGDVTEAGFFYKADNGNYTKVAVESPSTSLSYYLTGLTPSTVTYTYYAYAVYGGNEETGEEKTFTTVATGGGDTPTLQYTLTPASGSNNGYANNCDITINGITWNLTGNSTFQPWRIGGKSLSGVDRALYSKTALAKNISKIEITHGEASSITVNSMTVTVASDANFSNVISTLTPTFAANKTVTIDRPSGKDWSNCYYKIVYNVTVSGSSNKFVEFSEAKFYGTN